MRTKGASVALHLASVIGLVLLLGGALAVAQQETVLHSFGSGTDGLEPGAAMIFDTAGNLYGTTSGGGIHGHGTVFELTPREGGGWTETVLHSFDYTDGSFPDGLVFDSAGNLYGLAGGGGLHDYGAVFELSKGQDGSWIETVLHSFDGAPDGEGPFGSLVFDSAGNLYGTTSYGGIHDSCYPNYCGAVFELSPREGGGWTETVLHSFGNGSDGIYPQAGLVFDQSGNLYGTTYQGGIHGGGTVFELSPRGGGGWAETVLRSLGGGTDGYWPSAPLIVDGAGNLYGTTPYGGIHDTCGSTTCGTVFEMSPREGGGWTETLLHSFNFTEEGTDGFSPLAGLVMDGAGNLYGTTGEGGIHFDGTAFELSPRDGGGYTERLVHSFGRDTDGLLPFAGLVLDGAGNLYGTTDLGGIHEYGTAFVIAP